MALVEAAAGFSEAVVFPPNALDHADRNDIAQAAIALGMTPIFRLRPAHYRGKNLGPIESLRAVGAKFELLIDGPVDGATLDAIVRAHPDFKDLTPVFIPTASTSVHDRNPSIPLEGAPPALRSRLQILAPTAPLEPTSRFLQADELHCWLETIHQADSSLALTPYEETDRHHPQAPPDHDRSQPADPITCHVRHAHEIRVSVILPWRDRAAELTATLDRLAHQTLPHSRFELILVSDRDQPEELNVIEAWIRQAAASLNIRLLRLREPAAHHWVREIPIRFFTAYDAGALAAHGDRLVFLKDDIHVPPDFLADVIEAHTAADVVLYRIDHPSAPKNPMDTTSSPTEATELAETTGRLNSPDRWSLAPTSCLSVRSQDYFRAGGFPRGFIEPEYAEALLAWRLSHLNLRWDLRTLSVHRTHPSPPSKAGREWRSEPASWISGSSESARIFYASTLDEDVYRFCFGAFDIGTGARSSVNRSSMIFWIRSTVLRLATTPLARLFLVVVNFFLLFWWTDEPRKHLKTTARELGLWIRSVVFQLSQGIPPAVRQALHHIPRRLPPSMRLKSPVAMPGPRRARKDLHGKSGK